MAYAHRAAVTEFLSVSTGIADTFRRKYDVVWRRGQARS